MLVVRMARFLGHLRVMLAVLLGASALAAASGCAGLTATERARSLARQHREVEAIGVLRGELGAHPDDVDARRLLVRLLAYTSDLNGARAEVAELEKRLPKGDPLPWLELGHAFELAHRFEEALASYDTASSVAPDSPAGPREGGMRCARWGEADEARPRLEEAIKRGARDAETYHALGLVRLHGKDLDGAEEAYRAGLAAEPKGTENLTGLATVAVVRGDGAAALAAYTQILERRPAFGAAELGRAWALAKLGRKDDARKALDHAEALGAPRENIAKQRAALVE
jgi:tetratricopeptide (TPR) repeat protein